VISTKVGSIPDVIEDDETGLLVDPENLEGLKEGIEHLFQSDLEEMSEKCRETALEEYSWDSVVEKTEEVYEELNS
jgi:glycosyltransferase involved in cell wall biosynthesis